ncbi:MAG: hypothetical protein U1E51_07125, partial [Candidatus Binatia bacterium]|nr:hypothetical protein [Candidatus Binatia bacterium]
LPPAVEKVEGVSSQVRWKFEVMDLKALLLAVAKGEVPIQALQPNEVFIGQQVRSLRDAFRYPGVKAWPEKSISSR